jgi:cytidylate kinase
MAEVPVITVDGPSGTGKGTLSAYLADWLGWHLLDSGALYRVLALAALRAGTDLDDEAALATLARDMDVVFGRGGAGIRVMLNGEDVSGRLRTEECGNAASRIAAMGPVREALVERQRAFQQPPGLIADGRDMGTVIFPHAPLKLFLTASPGERAKRRYKQLIEQGISVNLHRLSADITERDERDSKRAASPLKPATDAIIIDTTEDDIDAVKARVSSLVRERFAHLPD